MLAIMETISGKRSWNSDIGRTSRGDDLFGSLLIAASTCVVCDSTQLCQCSVVNAWRRVSD